jgi:DNA polymerase-3 subunit chi
VARVDFYLLPDVDEDARHRFVCRLAYKAVTGGARVHVHARDQRHVALLDRLLWEYPDHQFLPHSVADDPDACHAPLVIGHEEPVDVGASVLINLAEDIPPFFGRFERVAEVVIEPARKTGRDRYRYYRERGHALFHHELDRWEEK